MAGVGLYDSHIKPTYGNALLIVDPQLDFHTNVSASGEVVREYKGSLGVPGANEDSTKIAELITGNLKDIDEIYITMDTHMSYHIAHAVFWLDKNDKHPEPFETITARDVTEGIWRPSRSEEYAWALKYVTKLEAQQKFQLTIWPEHCKIGTVGHTIHEGILKAVETWERENLKCATYIVKGNSARTEHYSALKAEVPIPGSMRTKLNKGLLAQLRKHNKVFVCGQALSHCVNFTTRDMVEKLPKDKHSSIYIIKDASSPVEGFKGAGAKFLEDMGKVGCSIKGVKECESIIRSS